MTLAIVINYLDRTVMSAAAPTISAELQISPEMMGWIMSAFFLATHFARYQQDLLQINMDKEEHWQGLYYGGH